MILVGPDNREIKKKPSEETAQKLVERVLAEDELFVSFVVRDPENPQRIAAGWKISDTADVLLIAQVLQEMIVAISPMVAKKLSQKRIIIPGRGLGEF